jgi:hypothetical protein
MASHRPRIAGLKALLPTGALIAGVMAGGCAPAPPPSQAAAPSSPRTSETQSSPPTSSTSDSQSRGTTSAPTTQSQPAQTSRCHTSQLAGSLQKDQSGLSAYGNAADLMLRNTSRQTCTVYGFPGLQLFSGGDGRPLPTNAVRENVPNARVVTLAPGASATALLQWNEPADLQQDPSCDGPAVGQVGVIPPDETTSLEIPWPRMATGNPNQDQSVCNNGDIKVTPFHQ